MNKDERILRLISRIDSGTISSEEVFKRLDMIEKNSNDLYVIYDVNERTDPAYYEELLSNARIGIYNKQSLIRMAEIKYDKKSTLRKKAVLIIGGVALAATLITIIVILAGGKS
jgi:hypothetical protein